MAREHDRTGEEHRGDEHRVRERLGHRDARAEIARPGEDERHEEQHAERVPAHHPTPARMTRSDSTSCAWASAATPIAAAITGVPSAAGKIRRRTSRTRDSAGSNRSPSSAPGRVRSHAAATAARVAPSAITAAVSGGEPSERLARSAPNATPGASRSPERTSAATAIPEAGQMSETLLPKSANTSPSFAAPKYAAARTRFAAMSRSTRVMARGVTRLRADAAARP